MNDIGVLLAILTVAGQQAAEHLFGGLFSGGFMRYVAIGTTVGLAFVLKILAPDLGIPEFGWVETAVIGVLAGLGSNVFHGILSSRAPGANKGTLVDGFRSLGTWLSRLAPQPPPAPPPVPPVPPASPPVQPPPGQ